MARTINRSEIQDKLRYAADELLRLESRLAPTGQPLSKEDREAIRMAYLSEFTALTKTLRMALLLDDREEIEHIQGEIAALDTALANL